MHYEPAKHQKIRFRRDEITNLSELPSAEGQRSHLMRDRTRRRLSSLVLTAGGVASVMLLICLAAAIAFANSGWGTETLRRQAERSVQSLAGQWAKASVGPASLAFGVPNPMSLELRDVKFANAESGAPIAELESIDFGIQLLPLLQGDLRLGSANISGATINTAAIPSLGGSDWTQTFRDERGLVDPDLVAAAVFQPLHALFDAFDGGLLGELAISDITVALPEGNQARTILIEEGMLTRASDDGVAISILADVDGRPVTLTGATYREPQSRRIRDLSLEISTDALPEEAPAGAAQAAGRLGSITLSISGAEQVGSGAQQLKLSAAIEGSVVDLGARGAFTGNVQLDAALATGSKKIEVERLLVETGRNSMEFNGAVGPRPATGTADDKPVYRYEMLSTRAVLAPSDSPEPAVEFQSQLEGIFDPQSRVLSADRIAIRAASGVAIGTAKVDLVDGKAPGVSFALDAQNLQVSHAKQLWPWFAASSQRKWALEHVFGGELESADIELRVEPGRLGNGVPLSSEEISGRFVVNGTRFDTYGQLPPVREASGVLVVHGRDVEITMSSGVVYLPSGRFVTGRNGTLSVKGSNRDIGKLDVQVEGEAGAIVEFASLEPLNANRILKIDPAGISGMASGQVITDIPFKKGIDGKSLQWLVSLDYTGLSLDKPLAGQLLTKSDGRLVVEPTQATLSAKGLLNGMPADIDLVEPLRSEGPQRQRIVELALDNAAREKIAPGLNALVSGPLTVRVEDQDEQRRVSADLTKARLTIPWVGWSKGAGVSAKAEFSMQTLENSLQISDFEFSGDTFSVAGDMTFAGGELSSARFQKARLNRDDDVGVNIDRKNRTYTIDIKGTSLDARSAIKSLVSDSPDSDRTKKTSTTAMAVRLDVAKVAGFNGESLSSVSLVSDGATTRVSGVSRSGREFAFENASAGPRKRMAMQAGDAGAILRFLDLYKHMQGGTIQLDLAGNANGSMSGQIDARNFLVVDEPKLASIVASQPAGSDRSLNEAAPRRIDASRVLFERGSAQIARGGGALQIKNGVLRGPAIGATFQGTLYDRRGNIDMTGTFMPIYGLNRIFGEIPLFGTILGNGRDRGLIGVTFKLDGDAKSPRLQVNPLSVIAPGIFRQIFEFN